MELRQTIWNLMGEERRLAAAKSFWESSEQKGAQRQVEQVLAQRLHARPEGVGSAQYGHAGPSSSSDALHDSHNGSGLAA